MNLRLLLLSVLLPLSLGCLSVPEELVIEGDHPGVYWEFTSYEGPVKFEEVLERGFNPKENPSLKVVEVSMVELTRRGWGQIFPWCWFGPDQVYFYYFKSEEKAIKTGELRGWQESMEGAFLSIPPGALTDLQMAYALRSGFGKHEVPLGLNAGPLKITIKDLIKTRWLENSEMEN